VRVLVVGAGALGTCYATLLAAAGARVSVLVRPQHRDAYGDTFRLSGLRDALAPVRPVTSGTEVGETDYLLLTTKAGDTDSALAALDGVEPGTVLSLQNGLAKNDALARRFGAERVLGAACAVGAALVEPGHARVTMNVATWVGELQGGPTERVVRLVSALRAAGLPAWSVPDASAVEWYKLCFLVPGALVTALSRRTYAEMCLHPDLAGLWVRLMRETFSVPRALGIRITTPPASPWRAAEWLDQPDDVALAGLREIGLRQRADGERLRPSLMQDVLAARRTEAQEVIGPLVERARSLDVPVPATETCYRLVRGLEDGFSEQERR
jgi:2-dehydropantoate 2-reductase